MKTISIHDAKTNLSKYIAAAKKGERIYIGGFGKAEVVLSAITDPNGGAIKRDFAVAKGKLTAQSDAFTSTTEAAIAQLMLEE